MQTTLRRGAWKPAIIGLSCSTTHGKSSFSSGGYEASSSVKAKCPCKHQGLSSLLHFGKILPYRHCLLPSAAFPSPKQARKAHVLATPVVLLIQVPCVGTAVNAIGGRRWSKTKPPKNLRAEGTQLCVQSLFISRYSSSFHPVLKLSTKLLSLTFTISFLSAPLPAGTSKAAASQQKGLHDLCNSTHWERLNQFLLFLGQQRP